MAEQKKGALTVSQQRVEEWINQQIAEGNELKLEGLIDDDKFKRANAQFADFRVKVETDKDLIERVGKDQFDVLAAFREAEHVKWAGDDPKEAHTEDSEEMEQLFAALFGTEEEA